MPKWRIPPIPDLQLSLSFALRQLLQLQKKPSINSINYWKSNSQLMLDTYLTKPTEVLEREIIKDEIMFSILDKIKPESLLEVGCGFGYTLKKIALKYPTCKVFGCDFAANLIDIAHGYCEGFIPNNHLQVADSSDLSCYKMQKFDVVLTHGCMMCLTAEQLRKALIEVKKISRNIILIEPDYSRLNFIEKLKHRIIKKYPINDYRKIICEEADIQLSSVDNSLANETLITNTTFFCIKVDGGV